MEEQEKTDWEEDGEHSPRKSPYQTTSDGGDGQYNNVQNDG